MNHRIEVNFGVFTFAILGALLLALACSFGDGQPEAHADELVEYVISTEVNSTNDPETCSGIRFGKLTRVDVRINGGPIDTRPADDGTVSVLAHPGDGIEILFVYGEGSLAAADSVPSIERHAEVVAPEIDGDGPVHLELFWTCVVGRDPDPDDIGVVIPTDACTCAIPGTCPPAPEADACSDEPDDGPDRDSEDVLVPPATSTDTDHLDPIPGDTGGTHAICLAYPTPGRVVTQGKHGIDRAIDLDCNMGDVVRSPLPVPSIVTRVVTKYRERKCYASVNEYNLDCEADGACNNLVQLGTTIAGTRVTVTQLHLRSTPVKLGDVIPPFGSIGECGNVGLTCPGNGDGSHDHMAVLVQPKGEAAQYVYPGDLLDESCGAIVNCPHTCGADFRDDCCARDVIEGGSGEFGILDVTADIVHPYTVGTFDLDRYENSVGRVRDLVRNYPMNKPSSGAGAHPRIPGSGWHSAFEGLLPATRSALEAMLLCDSRFQTWTTEPGAIEQEARPLNCVTWAVASWICNAQGGRLPTEHEGAHAYRGGERGFLYPWGDHPATHADANYECTGDGSDVWECSVSDLMPVGSFRASVFGPYDLAGSLREWQLDAWTPRLPKACLNCAAISFSSEANRVLLGGDWMSTTDELIGGDRAPMTPDLAGPTHGVRCAYDR